jgi:hypothetical protein
VAFPHFSLEVHGEKQLCCTQELWRLEGSGCTSICSPQAALFFLPSTYPSFQTKPSFHPSSVCLEIHTKQKFIMKASFLLEICMAGWGWSLVTECLPSMLVALDSSPTKQTAEYFSTTFSVLMHTRCTQLTFTNRPTLGAKGSVF